MAACARAREDQFVLRAEGLLMRAGDFPKRLLGLGPAGRH